MIHEDMLDLVQEEAAELIHIISKCKRFGLQNSSQEFTNGRTNLSMLIQELGDLLSVVDAAGLIDHNPKMLNQAKAAKLRKLAVYGPGGEYFEQKGLNDPPVADHLLPNQDLDSDD